MKLKQLPLSLRNLIFTILQPGIVAGAIPFIIAEGSIRNAFADTFLFHHYLGIAIFFAGVFVMLHCIARFAMEGLGTLSPLDPTKRLVISGLYKFTRNPMYCGVMMILTGEIIFSKSVYLLIYSIAVFGMFNLFIAYKEEPRLKKNFGKDYDVYLKKTKRWL